MRWRRLLPHPTMAVALAAIATAGLAGCGAPPDPATRVLLPAPAPGGPTARGTFVRDPQGGLEQLAATGHLVAWTVRTPADRLPRSDHDYEVSGPLTLPHRTRLVVVDERGGPALEVDLGHRWVASLVGLRGAAGARSPQLALRTCADLAGHNCAAELLTLTPSAPLRITARGRGTLAESAASGRIDSGHRLLVGPAPSGRPCAPALRIARLDGSAPRTLPAITLDRPAYPICTRLADATIFGRYVFVTLDGHTQPSPETGDESLDGTTVVAFDLDAGPRARWHAVQHPYSYTPGGTSLALGPAITDRAMYWEATSDGQQLADTGTTNEVLGLNRVPLPTATQRQLRDRDATIADPSPRASRPRARSQPPTTRSTS